MNRKRPLRRWALSVWCLATIACSGATTHPPPLPDCNGGKGVVCTTQSSAGGAGNAGGTGGADSATDEDAGSTPGSCGTADALLLASSENCQPCIETGVGSTTGGSCCGDDLACSASTAAGAACREIISCAVLCTSGNGACITTCIDNNALGATAFNDFAGCLVQNCLPECPNLMPAVASEQ
jgi:hypothetical protein